MDLRAVKTLTVLVLLLWLATPVCAQKGTFTLSVVDSETKEPLEFRLEVRNARGVAQHVPKIPFLYEHMSVPKSGVTMEFPLGTFPLKIERGLEYLPVSGHFVLNRSSKDARKETLKRFIDMASLGWWSGDLLVLRDQKQIETLMKADDVHFVPLMNVPAGENGTETWFDSNRVYSTGNCFLNHPDCGISILNASPDLDLAALNLEEKKTRVPLLAKLKQKDKNLRVDLVNSESWDLPLLLALKLVDTYQLLGPHILPSQMLPKDVEWRRIPRVKKTPKLDLKQITTPMPKGADVQLGDDDESDDGSDGRSSERTSADTDDEDTTDLDAAQSDEDLEAPESRSRTAGKTGRKAKASPSSRKSKTGKAKTERVYYPSDGDFNEGIDVARYAGPDGEQHWTEDVYFHLLNAGFEIPPSAGSGSGLSPNPVGSNRMYVFVDRAEYEKSEGGKRIEGFTEKGANAGFSTQCWWKAVDDGAVVVTNGPLLQPYVESCLPGAHFEYQDDKPVKLDIALTLSTRSSIRYIEVIVNGDVVDSIPFQDYAKSGHLPPLEIKDSGWLMLRVVTEDQSTYCCALTAPYYIQLGEKPNPKQAAAAQFFYNWESARIRMLEQRGAFEGKDGAPLKTLHEFALKYWDKRR